MRGIGDHEKRASKDGWISRYSDGRASRGMRREEIKKSSQAEPKISYKPASKTGSASIKIAMCATKGKAVIGSL